MRGVGVRVTQEGNPVGWVVGVLRVVGPPQPPGAVRTDTGRARRASGGVAELRCRLDAGVVGPRGEVPVLQITGVTTVGGDTGVVKLVPGLLKNLQTGGYVLLVVNRDLCFAIGGVCGVSGRHSGGHLADAVPAVGSRIVDRVDPAARAVVVGDERVPSDARKRMPGCLAPVALLSQDRLVDRPGNRVPGIAGRMVQGDLWEVAVRRVGGQPEVGVAGGPLRR